MFATEVKALTVGKQAIAILFNSVMRVCKFDIITKFVNNMRMENLKQLKVLNAARDVFLRYGYKRVTMQDIAQAAQMSRPALYLIYANKEQVFKAVAKHLAMLCITDIRQGLTQHETVEAQLLFAFELWIIKSYQLITAAPESKELLDCCYEFNTDVFEEVGALFEDELTKIITPLIKQQQFCLSAKATAKILRSSARGCKDAAKNVAELRRMIKQLVSIVLLAIVADSSRQKCDHA